MTTAVSFPGSATFSLDGGHLIFGGSVSKINSWKITTEETGGRKFIVFGRSVTVQNMNTESRKYASSSATVRADTKGSRLMKE